MLTRAICLGMVLLTLFLVTAPDLAADEDHDDKHSVEYIHKRVADVRAAASELERALIEARRTGDRAQMRRIGAQLEALLEELRSAEDELRSARLANMERRARGIAEREGDERVRLRRQLEDFSRRREVIEGMRRARERDRRDPFGRRHELRVELEEAEEGTQRRRAMGIGRAEREREGRPARMNIEQRVQRLEEENRRLRSRVDQLERVVAEHHGERDRAHDRDPRHARDHDTRRRHGHDDDGGPGIGHRLDRIEAMLRELVGRSARGAPQPQPQREVRGMRRAAPTEPPAPRVRVRRRPEPPAPPAEPAVVVRMVGPAEKPAETEPSLDELKKMIEEAQRRVRELESHK